MHLSPSPASFVNGVRNLSIMEHHALILLGPAFAVGVADIDMMEDHALSVVIVTKKYILEDHAFSSSIRLDAEGSGREIKAS